jgi:hypothetical protein
VLDHDNFRRNFTFQKKKESHFWANAECRYISKTNKPNKPIKPAKSNKPTKLSFDELFYDGDSPNKEETMPPLFNDDDNDDNNDDDDNDDKEKEDSSSSGWCTIS